MNTKLKPFLETIIPFFMLGIGIALAIGLFILFSYLFVWGLIIGAILWAISLIKTYFFSTNNLSKKVSDTKGRVIEHDDKN